MASKKADEGLGLGENQNFLDRENQIFINKLNYICKNYDTAFKDVSKIHSALIRKILSSGKIFETSDGWPSPGLNGETASDNQWGSRQSWFRTNLGLDNREAPSNDSARDFRVLFWQEDGRVV